MVESCARAMRRMPVPSLGVAKHTHPIYGATSARLWAIDENGPGCVAKYSCLSLGSTRCVLSTLLCRSQLFATVRNEIDAAAPIVRVLADLASHFVWQALAGVALSDTQMYVVTLSKLVLCDSHNIFEWLFLDSKMAFSFCGRRSTWDRSMSPSD